MNEIITHKLLTLLNLKGVGPAFIGNNLPIIENGLKGELSFEDILTFCNKDIYSSTEIEIARKSASMIISDCKENDIEILNLFDNSYQNELLEIGVKYPIIYIKGNWKKQIMGVGIIGSRNASNVGKEIAKRIGQFVFENGLYIVNGLAEGIDAAGISSNEIKGNCIGVVPGGLAFEKYGNLQAEYLKQAQNILKNGGCLVSSFSPEVKQDQFKTVEYCKLQAVLSKSSVLVQSKTDGGSRFTIEEYAKLNRKLFVVNATQFDKEKESYSANNLLLSNGKKGLSEWCKIKEDKIRCEIVDVRGKNDYLKIIK